MDHHFGLHHNTPETLESDLLCSIWVGGNQVEHNTVAKDYHYPEDTVAWRQENRSKLEKEHHSVETLPLLQDFHSTVAKGH